MKLFTITILAGLLCVAACAHSPTAYRRSCGDMALEHAQRYEAAGYEVRIATGPCKGLLCGWLLECPKHAQAALTGPPELVADPPAWVFEREGWVDASPHAQAAFEPMEMLTSDDFRARWYHH